MNWTRLIIDIGVSAGMWDEQEWFEYMASHNIEDPYAKEKNASLDSFF